jgi:hypothetical protein
MAYYTAPLPMYLPGETEKRHKWPVRINTMSAVIKKWEIQNVREG